MKTKKLTLSVVFAIALLTALVVSCVAFSACGAPTYNVTWTVDPNATITEITLDNEAVTELPETVEEGQTLKFKVTPASGYVVDKVTGASLRNGYYTVSSIDEDVAITVTVKKQVSSISATGLTKTTYVANDSVDLTGLVVTATYADTSTETIPLKEGTADGYTVSPSKFLGGETEITISYQGQTTTVPVTVEYLVTIDLKGGTLADTSAYESLNNYKNEDGVITFSYLNVEENISLPTDGTGLTRTGYKFTSWSYENGSGSVVTITPETTGNITMKAGWAYAGVTLSTAELKTESEKPYLVVTGEFVEGVTSVALNLVDGTNVVSFDNVTKGTDNTFEAKFDLTKISAQSSLRDRWMTICFSDPDNKDLTEALIVHTNDVEVDPDQKVMVGKYNYLFKSDNSGSQLLDPVLKVYYNDAQYSFKIETTDGAEPSIKFVGQVFDESWYGGEIEISWWFTGNDPDDKATIGADGSFSVTVDLSKVSPNVIGYAHVKIKDKDGNVVVGATETNLASSACSEPIPVLEDQFVFDGNNKMLNAVTATRSDGMVYYVGNSFWDGILLYARNEAVVFTGATLENVSDKATLVLSGTYGTTLYTTTDAAQTAIATNFKYSVQDHENGWQYTTGGESELVDATVVVSEAGKFTVQMTLNANGTANSSSKLYLHVQIGVFGAEEASNFTTSTVTPTIGSTVTVGELTYTIATPASLGYTGWEGGLLMIGVTAAVTD